MTASPRELSNAIQADYDEIVEGRVAESARIGQWETAAAVAKYMTFGVIWVMILTPILSLLAGSLLGLVILSMMVFSSPIVLVPTAIVWFVATRTVIDLRAKRREAMFTLYGISVDATVKPEVYSVGVPAAWLKPQLHRTRAILLDEAPTGDTDGDLDEVVAAGERAAATGK